MVFIISYDYLYYRQLYIDHAMLRLQIRIILTTVNVKMFALYITFTIQFRLNTMKNVNLNQREMVKFLKYAKMYTQEKCLRSPYFLISSLFFFGGGGGGGVGMSWVTPRYL